MELKPCYSAYQDAGPQAHATMHGHEKKKRSPVTVSGLPLLFVSRSKALADDLSSEPIESCPDSVVLLSRASSARSALVSPSIPAFAICKRFRSTPVRAQLPNQHDSRTVAWGLMLLKIHHRRYLSMGVSRVCGFTFPIHPVVYVRACAPIVGGSGGRAAGAAGRAARLAGWRAGRPAGWPAGWRWLAGWVDGWLGGWLAGRMAGWLKRLLKTRPRHYLRAGMRLYDTQRLWIDITRAVTAVESAGWVLGELFVLWRRGQSAHIKA